MLGVEAMQLLHLLEVHHVSSYKGFNAIKCQLQKKKAFWLIFCSYIHQTCNLRNEWLTFLDTTMLHNINLKDLMPAPVNNEFILASGILPCPEEVALTSLTTGFILKSHIFTVVLDPPCANAKQSYLCCETKDLVQHITTLRDRLNYLKHMLDDINPMFQPWNTKATGATTSSITTDLDKVTNTQRGARRANVHVMHLWLQNMLIKKINAVITAQTQSVSTPQSNADLLTSSAQIMPATFFWDEREAICRQLLHTLDTFSYSALESNGLSVVST